MADYSYGGDDETAELRKLNAEVLSNPDEFENWEKLVRAAETLEGGLNRNSSPQSISAARDVYDRFLAKFPLFFGYWKKYADLEFSIAGTESAEFIYERAVASIGVSVDLWTNYCNFKVETCHEPEIIRELFERAADSVGLDFLAHPFWDKYLEFEERLESPDRTYAILARIIHIPLHQYARYFEQYRSMSHSRPITELAPEAVLQQFGADSKSLARMGTSIPQDSERDIRHKADQYYLETFHRTQAETNKRWTFEQEIKRPYFHVTELDEAQLLNWTKYLDFEEAEGDYRRITFLYERCLVTAAHYDEFWQRYARYMYAQENKAEETRGIFARASCFYTPIARPAIRMQWALFEESVARPDVASEIYDAILAVMPDNVPAITHLANLKLRQTGQSAAVEIYEQHLNTNENSSATKGSVVAEFAKLIYQSTSDAGQARKIFEQYRAICIDSEPFWAGWLEFESSLPASAKHLAQVKAVHSQIRSGTRLSVDDIKSLSHKYMSFLAQRGDKSAALEYLELDALVNGSAVVGAYMRAKTSAVADGNAAAKVNGGR
ncbi:hypothetical protein K461DRAFT_281052 [Myriangium duriaei CBS 260.36]|uniref:Suppressor of forked domain-containing protein n=1 Tax=Myriangium duriaei CBS 260.36 TaxID=1168546 RepID=A0A9P4MDE4_9PEZI|nr:hypothetical protein K461DRAFT_281052 [Myriangium duriaei CBS 260.36]